MSSSGVERRADLLAELQQAAQTSTTDGILFHQVIADRVGLHVTDLRCLNVLAQAGPLTAGELGQRLGLATTGAVTRMVDRLERAGYVRREVDPDDRRRVIIHSLPDRQAVIASLYQGIATGWDELLATYSDEQLRQFLDLFDRMHQMSQRQLAALHSPSSDDQTPPS